MKQLLSQTDFFSRLLEIHNNPIPENVLEKIRQMAADPRFEISKVTAVSGSVACLFKWVTAVEGYVRENKLIAPKIKRRDDAKKQLEEAEINLKTKQDQLAEITAELARQQQEYQDNVNAQKDLQIKIEQCEYRLKNASALITALDSERVRWSENLVELNSKEKCILGDSLLIALHVAYVGPFSYPYRTRVINACIDKFNVLGVEHTESFMLENVAADAINSFPSTMPFHGRRLRQ